MANKAEDHSMPADHQLVLVAADPHIEDLVVTEPQAEDAEDLLPAKVFQMPVKVTDDDKVETKMAALIMVEREDLPLDAQKIIKEEIQEVKDGGGASAESMVPQPVTSDNTFALPPFEPYYYVGKLPNNFANSLTTNVSTNSLSMQKVSVDSTKLVDMLNMAKLSTQISSLNDSIHSFVVTSEPSDTSKVRFRGDTTSGLYSSSPCQSSDKFLAGEKSDNKSKRESDNSSETLLGFPTTSCEASEGKASGPAVNNFVGEVKNYNFQAQVTSNDRDFSNLEIGIVNENGKTICDNLNDIIVEDFEDDEMTSELICEQININSLPQEIMQRIFSHFTQEELLLNCAPVCKYWKDIAYDPIYWQTLKLTSDITTFSFNSILSRCRLLKSLELCGFDDIDEESIMAIANSCPMLLSLDMSFCDAVNLQVMQLICSSFPFLEKLNVEGCGQVDGLCVHSISQLTNLTDLNLSHCTRVNSTSIGVLAKAVKNLQHLNIDGIPQIKDYAISTLVTHQSDNLVSLHLDGAELTDVALFYLLKCKNLRRLLVSFAELLSDKSLLYIKEMTWLQELQLRKGDTFTNEGIYWLFDSKTLHGLTILNLSECTEVIDNSVIAIVECCGKSLKSLSLCWCYHIGDVGIEAIVELCSKLVVLDLLGLDKVYGYSFSKIPQKMPNLVFLNLQQCHKVVDSLIATVVSQMPRLVALNYYGEEFRHGSLP